VNHSNTALLLRLMKLARPHLGWMALGALLTLITAFASIGLLAVSGWFLASMAAAGIAGVTMNYFTPAGVIRFLAMTRTAGRYGERLVTHNATLKLLAELRVWFYRRLEPLAPARLQGLHSGDLLSRIQSDIDRLDNLYLRILLPIVVSLVGVPLLLLLISRYDSQLALVALLGLMSVALLLPLWTVHRSQQPGEKQVAAEASLRQAQLDAVAGMRELLIYGADDAHQQHCEKLSNQQLTLQDRLEQINASGQAFSLLAINLTVVATLWLLIPQVAGELRPPPQLAMLALLILAGFELVLPMPLALEQLPATLASARRLYQLADQPPARPDPAQPLSLPTYHSISINAVTFAYPGQQTPALNSLSLDIQHRQKVALIGPSGAGKSTLIQLLNGFWPISEGHIELGGTDINQLSGDALRSQIAVVPQHPHLFSATLAENLRMANPDATQAMMDDACQQAGLLAFIRSLPEGYNTWLGEQGQGLSGGQARRFAIARALLKDAPVLILDEPTEGLDPQTEQALIETLNPIMATRTVLVISHRPAILQAMDQICVLERGKVRAMDTHQQLLMENRYYQHLISLF